MKILSYLKSKLFAFYLFWAFLAILISFIGGGGLTNDKITHLIIIFIGLFSFVILNLFKVKNPKLFFISSSVFLASLVEGAYMISRPVFKDLLVPENASLGLFINNWFIDLCFTIPAYIFIFSTIWWLINRYSFSKREYFFWFALGQALSDGFAFFLSAPAFIILVPYVMLNYHAMNFVPFLAIQDSLQNKPRKETYWKYPIVIISIWVVYMISGITIKMVGHSLGFVSF